MAHGGRTRLSQKNFLQSDKSSRIGVGVKAIFMCVFSQTVLSARIQLWKWCIVGMRNTAWLRWPSVLCRSFGMTCFDDLIVSIWLHQAIHLFLGRCIVNERVFHCHPRTSLHSSNDASAKTFFWEMRHFLVSASLSERSLANAIVVRGTA